MNERQLRALLITPEVAEFLISLHEKFENIRYHLLMKRRARWREFAEGARIDFLPETLSVRNSEWHVAPAPADLQDRRVEITSPVDPKMMINALNSGARVFMADLEDALSPTWKNVLQGHLSLNQAVRRHLKFVSEDNKTYSLNQEIATLVVRPRGLHLEESNFQIRGHSISASLFDFGLYFFHNAQELIRRGSGPYFYLPKLETHEESSWWNEVFIYAQEYFQIPQGTIRATVLIETITAAFEMDEILYSLKEHASGLNAGRWDYIFSIIKKFNSQREFLTPDRDKISMEKPFMDSYCHLLVQTCHKRRAHAIGGMSAFIPNRQDPEITGRALHLVADDKRREARLGFDGTWVAHPDLVPVADEEFSKFMRHHKDQKFVTPYRAVTAKDLLEVSSAGGEVSERGVRTNINIVLQYMDRWFAGFGAVAINNMMEDMATAEISRSQLWQWLHHEVRLNDGRILTPEVFNEFLRLEVHRLIPENRLHLDQALKILTEMVFAEEFPEFMTMKAYEMLNQVKTQGENQNDQYRDASPSLGL